MTKIALLIYLTLSMTVSHAVAGQVAQPSDPGSAGMETVGGLRFSCPNRFRRSDVLSTSKIAYLMDDGSSIGLIVRKIHGKLNEKESRALASEVVGQYLVEDATIQWKSLDRGDAISKYEIQTESFLGFNGTKLVLFQFRIVEAKGQKIMVGYFASPSPRGDEKERFNQGEGFSCNCDDAQAHVIASITGETFESIARPRG
jgi:hypothetical protein